MRLSKRFMQSVEITAFEMQQQQLEELPIHEGLGRVLVKANSAAAYLRESKQDIILGTVKINSHDFLICKKVSTLLTLFP